MNKLKNLPIDASNLKISKILWFSFGVDLWTQRQDLRGVFHRLHVWFLVSMLCLELNMGNLCPSKLTNIDDIHIQISSLNLLPFFRTVHNNHLLCVNNIFLHYCQMTRLHIIQSCFCFLNIGASLLEPSPWSTWGIWVSHSSFQNRRFQAFLPRP